ncbi:MAG: hypothetical protein LLF76_02370 [Planctomycetaceae bacterium]|nr:hypothetical protein [Planctomycetaceae bacterium]
MDARDTIEMSDDYTTMSQVMEDHGLTVKWLASQIGRGQSTVYKYLAGELTIPSIVWRRLYARTRDQRILDLFAGEIAVVVVELPDCGAGLDQATLKDLVSIRKEEIQVEEQLLKILEDGIVDCRDARKIEEYRVHHQRMMATCCRMYQKVVHEFERSRKP